MRGGKRRSLGSFLLRNWRLSQDMTQPIVADKIRTEDLKADFMLISRLENGVRPPNRALAVRIAVVTGHQVPVEAWDLPEPPNNKALAKAS